MLVVRHLVVVSSCFGKVGSLQGIVHPVVVETWLEII